MLLVVVTETTMLAISKGDQWLLVMQYRSSLGAVSWFSWFLGLLTRAQKAIWSSAFGVMLISLAVCV